MAAPQLVVMAAGIGSRYGGLKQIDPIGPSGEIIIDYAVYDALAAGFGKVVFIIRRDIEAPFREKIGRTIEKQIDTEYVFQELDDLPAGFSVPPGRTKPWGTAHAVLCAKDAVDATFAVINADDFYGCDSFRAIGEYLQTAADKKDVYDYSMVGFVLKNTLTEHGYVSRGCCTTDEEGYLATIVERVRIEKFRDTARYTEDGRQWTDISPDTIVSMNMWGFTPSFMDELAVAMPKFLQANIDNPKSEIYIPTVVNELIRSGKARAKVLHTDEKWLGVTYQQDKPQVIAAIRAKVADGIYPENLWEK
jgi:dTDP-glucose pyrophosphorylase